ncbi:MAG: biotin--[acetyl-CoA-carboxylase] ligase [Bacteroidota bacterium]|nr:biotin--[acetyl-CoA-carboxylase] ligase [Bacteroidota bacterium]
MKNMIIGSSIISLDKINSTNSYANQLSVDKKPISGTVILAQEQTEGKGQEGNKWESQVGKNLTFSILLFPDKLRADHQFILSKAISLGIIDYLKPLTKDFSIKWPNDIYCNNRKIAGILIENSVMGSYLSESIVGIGLNVNQEYFSKEANNPVSLKALTNTEFVIVDELNKLLECLDIRYKELIDKKYDGINDSYLINLFRYNEIHEFTSSGIKFSGKIVGVSVYGKLQIELADGTISLFGFKEVEYVI